MPKVSVIIVNWNRLELTKNCLRSLAAQIFRDFEIIVVDNGSTDGSERLATIRNDKNLGFARAVNQGIRAAKGQYIALLNDDAVANKFWLESLIEAANKTRESVGMFASTVIRTGDYSPESYGCYIYPDGNGMCIHNTQKYPDFPSGCASMYRRSMLDKIGLFDESFFCYNEDTELGIRAQKAGYFCCIAPFAIVFHHGSASTSKNSLKKLYWVEKNRIRIMMKHFTWLQIVKSPYWTFKRYLRGGR
jgi:GT2 family glycosyltransferase